MNEKLQEIKEENLIIFIYFILLFTYLYANKVEIDYIKTKDNKSREKYRNLLFIVFGISFIITLYYVINSLNELKEPSNSQVYKLKELSTISNILILIATGIYLYIIYKDEDVSLEVSP